MVLIDGPITIKRSVTRRFHRPEAARRATLGRGRAIVMDAEDFAVRDSGVGTDVARSIPRQVIFERRRHG